MSQMQEGAFQGTRGDPRNFVIKFAKLAKESLSIQRFRSETCL